MKKVLYVGQRFYGQRGTPYGFSATDAFSLIICTTRHDSDITLFDQGLVKNERDSAQPQLPPHLVEKMEQGWEKKELEIRTQRPYSTYLTIFKIRISYTMQSSVIWSTANSQ